MSKKQTWLTGLLGVFVGIAIALTINTQAGLPLFDSQGARLPSLAPMLKRINPAVVNISVKQTQQANNPLLDDPFFRQFFNIPDNYQPRQREARSAGSGVIVDAKKGLVITNYHVIQRADKITVSLTDGRNIDATLVGSDPEVDIAVLRIKAKGLSSLKLADSEVLNVGDFAVAIGNPFGLGQTVTTGIVSALGRSGLGIQGYENFIQTDASINPGNSGGALVNLNGELIGVNTAIIAPSGGNVGIGFAIPSNMVKYSMNQILKHGKVSRGQLGVYIQDLNPELLKALGASSSTKGVLISKVAPKSPAEKAGIQEGDIVTHVDGKRVEHAGELRNLVGIKGVGQSLRLEVIRDGRDKEIVVTSRDHVFSSSSLNRQLKKDSQSSGNQDVLQGAVVSSGKTGVEVQQVRGNSKAAQSGLRRGDVIIGANRVRIKGIKQLSSIIKKSQRRVLLQINRSGNNLFLVYSR